jgi:hypothetical protein
MTRIGQSSHVRESQLLSSPTIEAVLALLRSAHDAAHALNRDIWEFAVEIDDLHAVGATNTHLRLLVCEGYAMHAVERIRGHHLGHRSFCKLTNLALPSRSCFVITKNGLGLSDCKLDPVLPPQRANAKSPSTVNRPLWDGILRQLHWNGLLVKQFRLPATNQEAILEALEEDGWPPHVDDPLPPVEGLDPKVRLHDAIKSLNRNQINRLLTFRGDGSGQGVLWFSVKGSVPSPDLPLSGP